MHYAHPVAAGAVQGDEKAVEESQVILRQMDTCRVVGEEVQEVVLPCLADGGHTPGHQFLRSLSFIFLSAEDLFEGGHPQGYGAQLYAV